MRSERILAALSCPVRGCGEPMSARERALVCVRGHAFDVARDGYVNLLQPQDRRSLDAGDSREVVRARRALVGAGFGAVLAREIEALVARAGVASAALALDLGCGEGSILAALARRFELEAVGIDLSAHAIEIASRAHPRCTWLVANADRALPFQDGAIDLALSIDGRRPAGELGRVVRPGGTLVVAVPGEDDLVELREAVLGRATSDDRLARVERELATAFDLVERTSATARVRLDAAGIANLARSTYRFARASQRARLAALGGVEVTTSHALGRFTRR